MSELVAIPTRQEMIQNIINSLMNQESYLSYSSLSHFKCSPKDFIDYKLREVVETDAMRYGTMVHCLVLEPSAFESRYLVIDDKEICAQIGGAKPRATKAYKEWKDEIIAGADGRKIVEPDEIFAAQLTAASIKNNRATHRIFKQAPQREYALEWKMKNFIFRGVIDALGDDIIIDLKTCADASPRKFQRDIISMDYHMQAALYLTGIGQQNNKLNKYYIVAADKTGGVSVHHLQEDLINYALDEVNNLLDQFNQCILDDAFNESYEFYSERIDGIYSMDKPAYLYK